MKKARFSRYYLLLGLPVLLALVGLIWARPAGGWRAAHYDLDDLNGRYISAEIAYDSSSVHEYSSDSTGGLLSSPTFFSETEVMEADGNGHVCGSSDGFYAGMFPGGTNFGQGFFHGTYSIDSNGRITILTCSDTAFCATTGACSPASGEQVGYLESTNGNKVTTASQGIASSGPPGYIVRTRVWTKDTADQNKY